MRNEKKNRSTGRTKSMTAKVSVAEEQLIRAYCERAGVSPSFMLRELALREVGARTLPEPDASTAMLRLFIETTRAQIMAGASGIGREQFEAFVRRFAPGFIGDPTT